MVWSKTTVWFTWAPCRNKLHQYSTWWHLPCSVSYCFWTCLFLCYAAIWVHRTLLVCTNLITYVQWNTIWNWLTYITIFLILFQYKAIQTEVWKKTKTSLQVDSKAESNENDVWHWKSTADNCVVDLQGLAKVSSQAC